MDMSDDYSMKLKVAGAAPVPAGWQLVPIEPKCPGFEIEPGVYNGCDQSAGDCPVCGK